MSRLLRMPLALVLLLLSLAARAGVLTVEVLDVGQGDSILITSPEGRRVLIDAGVRGAAVAERLKDRGIDELDLVIATHPHADHIGGMADVLRSIPVRFYTDNGLPHTTRIYKAVMDAVEEEGVTYRPAERGQSFKLDDGARIEVLFPDGVHLRNTRSDLNSNSVVVRLTHGDDCFLFVGDAEDPTERALLDDGVEPCGVLKVAHHGSSHSTSAAWLRAVQPRIALISVGADNRYGHPDDDTLERLRAAGVTVFRTDTQGTLRLESDRHHVVVYTQDAPDAAPDEAPDEAAEGRSRVALARMRRLALDQSARPGARRGLVAPHPTSTSGAVPAEASDDQPGEPGSPPATARPAAATERDGGDGGGDHGGGPAPSVEPDPDAANGCAFIASRNSRLYHPAGCHVVDRIFIGNRVCYATAADAEAAGKTRSHACPAGSAAD